MDILFLTHRIPYPPDKGDKIRSHALLVHLAKYHRVHVACFVDDPADMAHAESLRQLAGGECLLVPMSRGRKFLSAIRAVVSGQSITAAYFSSRLIRDWIKALRLAHTIDRTVVFCSAMAPYINDGTGLDLDRTILDLVDIDSDKWLQYSAAHKGIRHWVYQREAKKVFELERAAAQSFRATLLSSQYETASFAALVPESADRLFALTNGVDREYFAPGVFRNPFPENENPIVMTGRMDYWPNVEGATWFLNEILPVVAKQLPNARFYVVGATPARPLRALSDPRLVVTGRVDDIRPYLQHASAVVAPLRIARGVQNKVLEAMAMAKVVVATHNVCRSLVVSSGVHLWIEDDPLSFAEAVVFAVHGKDRLEIARRARDYVELRHDWARNLSVLDELLAVRHPRLLEAGPTHSNASNPCDNLTSASDGLRPSIAGALQ